LNNSHAEIINLKVLRPYHSHNERLFNNLREAHDFAPKVAQQMAYEALLVEDRAFDGLFRKIRSFVLKTDYEPLTSIEYSIFDGAIKFYKKSIEESKVDLAARMVTQPVIEAYIESQQTTVELADKILNKILKLE
jgi:hypothetical protein